MILHNKKSQLNLAIHFGASVPAIWLALAFVLNKLGPNPIQALEQRSGDVALILLLLTLTCTPLRLFTGYTYLNSIRRTLGLYTFAYAALHLLLFTGLDYAFAWGELWLILKQKWYIWFGLSSFLILLLLTLTSSRFSQSKLKKNWQRLHSLIYLAAVLVIVHFTLSLKGNLFLLKGNIFWPLMALIAFLLLIVFRLKPIRQWIKSAGEKISHTSSNS